MRIVVSVYFKINGIILFGRRFWDIFHVLHMLNFPHMLAVPMKRQLLTKMPIMSTRNCQMTGVSGELHAGRLHLANRLAEAIDPDSGPHE